ncbi:protein dpy-30 homolog [Drosophila busckii]|nr:protein dpy-30 homolog [Drosophila busckii]
MSSKRQSPKLKKHKKPKNEPVAKPVECVPIVKPEKQPKRRDEEASCNRPRHYRSASEQRDYLQKEAVPILMEGMLALAREQPKDPITYLERFWLQQQQKCDIPLPENLL